jgi:magnesium-protoporphyrin O-methyltransferase
MSMQCCNPTPAGATRFFSWFARRSRRHYQKKGLGKAQKQLVDGIREAGFEGASVLDIGCGIGFLHQELLKAGAAHAVGVDLSEKMLAEARTLARQQRLEGQTDYRAGDFVEMAAALPDVDITILDKVVCCYPDAQTLVTRSSEKTAKVYALTYPRDHLFNRIMVALEAAFLWIIRVDFRPYVHDPDELEKWIRAQGFHKRAEQLTWVWLTQVYAR